MKKKTLDPVWGESFQYKLDAAVESALVWFKIYDKDLFTRDGNRLFWLVY